MNIFFKYWGKGEYSDDPKLFLDWYRHADSHKHKGLTLRVGLLGYTLDWTWVDDQLKYAQMSRSAPDYTLALLPVPAHLRKDAGKNLKGA